MDAELKVHGVEMRSWAFFVSAYCLFCHGELYTMSDKDIFICDGCGADYKLADLMPQITKHAACHEV